MTSSLAYSHAMADAPWWQEVYRSAFPDMASMVDLRHNGWHQKAGRDRAVILSSGRALYVDEKVRSKVFRDIAIELWSVYPRDGAPPYPPRTGAKPGWAREAKDCDFLAYAFVPVRTCYLYPFQSIRAAVERHRVDWINKATDGEDGFSWIRSPNRDYLTISVGVPIDKLAQYLADAMVIGWQA